MDLPGLWGRGVCLGAVTHTLGKVPVHGGGPGFPSPW